MCQRSLENVLPHVIFSKIIVDGQSAYKVNPSTRQSERASKIVETAAHLFARQGYHGTSTREIARIAKISENTLFRYFDHKEEIFWAALRLHMSGLELQKELQLGFAENADPEVVIPQILAYLLDDNLFKPESQCLIAIAFIELRLKAEVVCFEYLSPIVSAVNRYLASNIESGKLRAVDPSIVTAALIATTVVYPRFSRLISGIPPPHSHNSEAVQSYAKFWLEILAPPPISSAPVILDIVDQRLSDI
jgi:AcrR family transcriptional regulator